MSGGMSFALPEDIVIIETNLDTENQAVLADAYPNTQAEAEDQIELVISADTVDTLGLFGMEGTELVVEQLDSDGVSLGVSWTIPLLVEEYTDIWGYWYDPFDTIGDQILGIYPEPGGRLSITVKNAGSTAKLARVAIGYSRIIGDVEVAGTETGTYDYSEEVEDDTGTSTVDYGSAKWSSFSVLIPIGNVDRISRKLDAARGKPCIWRIAKLETMWLYGRFTEFRITYEETDEKLARCEFEIKSIG